MALLKSISPNVNVMTRLEFELAYYDVAVQQAIHGDSLVW